jgi:hypothetical protein
MKFTLTILASCIIGCLFAQKDRYFTSEKAIEWLPQLVGTNIQIIGEKNEKEIKATDTFPIEFLFITDTEEKAKSLIKAIENTSLILWKDIG